MLQQDSPDDYVVATGEGATVAEFCEAAFSKVNLDWNKHVIVDNLYRRPTEVDKLIGDPSKAARVLGWKAQTKWKALADLMVEADLSIL